MNTRSSPDIAAAIQTVLEDWFGEAIDNMEDSFRVRRLLLKPLIKAASLQPATPTAGEMREAFENWATKDRRAIQPAEFEDRTDDNNHYYADDCDNSAFIGWKAALEATGGDAVAGFFAGLSPEQQKAALAYRGPENHGVIETGPVTVNEYEDAAKGDAVAGEAGPARSMEFRHGEDDCPDEITDLGDDTANYDLSGRRRRDTEGVRTDDEAATPRKWDEGEHEGCGIDSQRALEREKAARASLSNEDLTRLYRCTWTLHGGISFTQFCNLREAIMPRQQKASPANDVS